MSSSIARGCPRRRAQRPPPRRCGRSTRREQWRESACASGAGRHRGRGCHSPGRQRWRPLPTARTGPGCARAGATTSRDRQLPGVPGAEDETGKDDNVLRPLVGPHRFEQRRKDEGPRGSERLGGHPASRTMSAHWPWIASTSASVFAGKTALPAPAAAHTSVNRRRLWSTTTSQPFASRRGDAADRIACACQHLLRVAHLQLLASHPHDLGEFRGVDLAVAGDEASRRPPSARKKGS